MLKTYIKHNIYELCLNVIFDRVSINFDKPIFNRKQYIQSVIAGVLSQILKRQHIITNLNITYLNTSTK